MRLHLEEEEEAKESLEGTAFQAEEHGQRSQGTTSLALGEQHGDKGSWGKVSIGELEGEEKGEGLRVG